MRRLAIAATLILAGVIAFAMAPRAQQAGEKADPVKVDPKHYKVEFENDKVRVLRVTYGSGEKSAMMHYHPDSVAVYLTDGKSLMIMPDGKSRETSARAGQVFWVPAGSHIAQNEGDDKDEVILI
jgi:quercetin dioxygenase-like cupin family protein